LEDSPAARGPTTPVDAIAGAGRILIAASGINEPAMEFQRHGLLTYALIEALQSPDETVSLPAVMSTVIDRVRAEANRHGHQQNPVYFGYVEGGLVFPSLRKGPKFFAAFPEQKGLRVSKDIDGLSGFGLPAPLLSSWKELFPAGLNDLQLQAINDQRVLDGESVFVVAPTSSGKTFIGELAAAKAIIDGRKAVFLFPYRALTNEKFDYFSRVYGEKLGMRVIRCTGDYLDQTNAFIRGKYDLAVLTYEMYLRLSVANPAILNTLGLLVVDEVQFISNSRRGIVVELLLTHVLSAEERGITPQIITLSAVVGGENAFDEWLGASKLITTTRPVPLIEGVLDRSGTYQFIDDDGKEKIEQLLPRHVIVQRKEKPSSQDVIVPLIKSLLAQREEERVIIFRNNKGATEGCAKYLAADLHLSPATNVVALLPATDRSTSSQVLRESLQGGTAFHNANLSREERVVVEQAFRQAESGVRVLAATTTVAAGINTPASTVVLAEQEFIAEENEPFSIAEYKNMAGRAGRLGYHEKGRSIILADNSIERQNLYRRYVLGKPERLRSSFEPGDLETWVLRLLSQVKEIPSEAAVKLLASTYGGFLASKADPSWSARTVQRLSELIDRMIKLGLLEEELGTIRLSLLGRACGRSSLRFRSAIRLVEALRKLDGTPVRAEYLMLLIQVLPELDDTYTPLMKRGQSETRWASDVAQRYGQAAARSIQVQAPDEWAYYARCKRVAVLSRWIAGDKIEMIEQATTTNAFQGRITAGNIRGFADATRFHLQSACQIAAVLLLENGPTDESVDVLLKRLETGLPADALKLLDLPEVLSRGEYLGLYAAGARTKEQVATMPQADLERVLGRVRASQLSAAMSKDSSNT
jgi:replicative superfamily II helicase